MERWIHYSLELELYIAIFVLIFMGHPCCFACNSSNTDTLSPGSQTVITSSYCSAGQSVKQIRISSQIKNVKITNYTKTSSKSINQ